MEFVKYHVCNGDRIVSEDARAENEARSLCDRHSGVGASGLVIVGENPFAAKFFRPDGREIPLDMSGVLCAGAYLCGKRKTPKLAILTEAGLIEIETRSGEMTARFPAIKDQTPKTRRADISTPTEYIKFEFAGAERIVCPTDDIYTAMLFGVGEKMSEYRSRTPFDVDFVSVISKDRIKVRSYERGAGYVTSADGAVLAAAAMSALGKCESDVDIAVDSGRMHVSLSPRPNITASVVHVMNGSTTR